MLILKYVAANRLKLLVFLAVFLRMAYVVHSQSYLNRPKGGAEMRRAAVSLAKKGTIANIYSDETGRENLPMCHPSIHSSWADSSGFSGMTFTPPPEN